MRFGSEVHAAFEAVGWIDESTPVFPPTAAGKMVAELLRVPKLRALFERRGRAIGLFREQAVDAVADGNWLSGIIDRLHVARDENGTVNHVEIIDFKTDKIDGMPALLERYAVQMEAYSGVLRQAWPDARIDCILLSTACRDWVAV